VGGDGNQRTVIQPFAAQVVKQLTDNIVRVSNSPVVRLVRKAAAERFGGIVGVVRVPQVKPHEKRAALPLAEPFEQVSQCHFAAALHRSFAVLAVFLTMKSCVINIEAALESGSKPVFWVEDDAADKSPCLIALGVENFG